MIVARRRLAAIAAVAMAAALALLPATGASAASSTGWLRLGHLSPDTKAVDVTLTNLSGGTVLYKLSKVAYGDVSPYMKLAAGTYALSMVPAGMPAGTTPVLKGAISVTAGKAASMIVVGLNKKLSTRLFTDDLADGAGTSAKVRIVQASVKHPTGTVKSGGTTLASGAKFGSVSSYSTLKAGSSTLSLTAGSSEDTAKVSLDAGTVHTLFVLDDAQGDLRVTPILDSAAVTVPPVGAIETGGGALGAGDAAALQAAGPAAAGAAAAAALLVLLLLRRRTGAERLDA
jgi:hypothetical protein